MKLAMVGAVGALVLALGGVSLGAQRADDTQIDACVNADGVLSIAPVSGCPQSQTALSWNEQGPQGIQGVQGVQGLTGPQGAPGVSATLPNVLIGPALTRSRSFVTQLIVSGAGKHLIEAHVHAHLDPTNWVAAHTVSCQLFPEGAPGDVRLLPAAAHSSPQDVDVDLSWLIDIPDTSGNPKHVPPRSVTLVFRCLPLKLRKTEAQPVYSFIRMTDTPANVLAAPLPVQTIKLK